MIQDSNAPNDMQPWVRQTESEIQTLKDTVQRLSVQLQNAGIGSDVQLNAGLDNAFNFINKEDGSISTEVGEVAFTGDIKSTESVIVDKSIIVGERIEFVEGEEGLEAGESAPYFQVTPGSFDVNPVTEKDFYTPGTFKVNDTSVDINGYGQISGNGLAITLSTESNLVGYRAEILDITSGVIYQQGSDWIEGDPEEEIPVTIYEVFHEEGSAFMIQVGEYVNITGCDPEELNENNALIIEVDISPGEYVRFKTLKDSSAITYVEGGEVSSAKPSEIYPSSLTVRGQGGANNFFGARVGPEGISVGPDGGNFVEAFSTLGKDGLITPSVTATESLTLANTRVFIQSDPPDEPFDGDLWIDPQNSADSNDPFFTGTTTGPRLRLTAGDGADLTSTDHGFQLGASNDFNIAMDRNSIMARNNGNVTTLRLNENGGNLQIGDSSSTITLDGRLSATHYPFAMASGGVTITPVANASTAAFVTFPAGRFTVEPNVFTTADSAATATLETTYSAGSTTGANIRVLRSNTTNTAVKWLAIQMTSTNANG
jgi:hypothetical protein